MRPPSRITAARDGFAAAPGLSCQRASGQCDVGTVRPRTARHFRQPAVSRIAIHALIRVKYFLRLH